MTIITEEYGYTRVEIQTCCGCVIGAKYRHQRYSYTGGTQYEKIVWLTKTCDTHNEEMRREYIQSIESELPK